jgi:cell division protein FtsZ
MMGLGFAHGDNRAKMAAEAAAHSPLLETSIQGARRLLVNIATGPDFTLGETHDVMEYLLQFTEVGDANIIMGHVLKEDLGDAIRVTVMAAGMHESGRGYTPYAPPAEHLLAPEVEAEVDLALSGITLDIPTFLRRQRQSK